MTSKNRSRRSLILLFTCLVNLLGSPTSAHSVYKGEPLKDPEFLVAIYAHSACTGTLIEPRIVLTAAHCIVNNGNVFPLSKIKVFQPIGGKRVPNFEFNVTEVFYEPSFFYKTPILEKNDIAFIVLEKEMIAKDKAAVMQFDFSLDAIDENTFFKIYGFGATTKYQGFQLTAGVSKVKIKTKLEDPTFPNTFSFTNDENGGACPGDSGAPIIIEKNNEIQVISILSGGNGPCNNMATDPNYWKIIGTSVGKFGQLYSLAMRAASLLAAADKAAADKAAADKAAADKAAADKAAADKAAADKAAADKAAADKAAASKKTTIACAKGKLIKKVAGVKPTCPMGYKKK